LAGVSALVLIVGDKGLADLVQIGGVGPEHPPQMAEFMAFDVGDMPLFDCGTKVEFVDTIDQIEW
jgi:hypothetical protein